MANTATTRLLLATTALCLAVSACSPVSRQAKEKEVQRIMEEMKGADVPGIEDALMTSAKQAEDARNYPKAAQFYKQLVTQFPDKPEFQFGYAESLRKSGQYDLALDEYAKLQEDKEFGVQAKEGMGLTLMAQGEFDEAGDYLADVMEADATRWRTINAIGILFTTKQMYPEARQYFAEAMAQSPKNIAVHNNLGLMEALDKQYDESIRLLQEASKLARKDSRQQMQTDMNLALVYAVKGDLDLAQQTASQHLNEEQLLNNMGYYAHLADDDRLAKSYLSMALTASDKHYKKAWDNLETLNKLINTAPRR